jgi:putative peptide zinc metalloprotease protein
MDTAELKLRSDLIISRLDLAAGVGYVLKDPSSGRYFNFKEAEEVILRQLDGKSSLETVRARVEAQFGGTLAPETLSRFVENLKYHGLLEDPRSGAGNVAATRGRIRGNPFYIRIKLFDPDLLLERLAKRLGILFTPFFVIGSGLLILFAAAVTVSNWMELRSSFGQLLQFHSLVLAWVTVLLVIAAHEFAHGVACKRFGGSVREIGFLLLYFQPAFYCNVSDAWLFPEKAKRLWVTFAGAYFEIFLWALATLVWRVTDPGSVINYAAVVVTATSGIKSLFNLNPLIKLDGYYLLSDYLELPNLRRRAFGYLRVKISRIWGAAAGQVKQVTPRERRIYLVYSILAATYSYWLFGFVLSRLAGFLTARYQAWGFVIFVILLAGLFRSPLRRILRGPISFLTNGESIMNRLSKPVRFLILGAALLLFLLFYRAELKVSGQFAILPSRNAEVRGEVEGIIEEIFHDEGDIVEKGAPIARLGDREYSSELDKIKAQIAENKAQLKLLLAGARPEEIQLAKTRLAKAEERLKYANKDLDMDKALLEKQIISQKNFTETEGMSVVRSKELEEAKEELRLLQAGSRKEEIEALEAKIGSLEAQQQFLARQVQSLTVTSPISGIITSHKLREKIGQNVKKGDLIATVNEMKNVTAEISVPEKEIADVRLGEKVVLKAQAYPNLSFEGTVSSIAPIASKQTESRDERTIIVMTSLDNSSMLLKPEMSGNAKIYCGDQPLINIIGRRLVRFVRVEFWSWW